MKRYFATTANGRKWTKSRRWHFHWAYFDDVHLRQGERYNCLLQYVCTQSIIITFAYSCKNKFTNYDFRRCIWRSFQSSTDQLCCSSSSLDGGYTDAEVGEIRDIQSYQFRPKPEMDEIQAKMAKPKDGLESGVRAHNGSLFFLLFTNKYFKSNQSFECPGFDSLNFVIRKVNLTAKCFQIVLVLCRSKIILEWSCQCCQPDEDFVHDPRPHCTATYAHARTI